MTNDELKRREGEPLCHTIKIYTQAFLFLWLVVTIIFISFTSFLSFMDGSDMIKHFSNKYYYLAMIGAGFELTVLWLAIHLTSIFFKKYPERWG